MMRFHALVLILALAACGQQGTPAETPEIAREASLQVEVRRYDLMLDQVQSLTADRPGVGVPEANNPGELARQLRETVWQYNIERSRLCARGLFTEVSCGPAYQPVWIAEPATSTPSLDELQTRAGAVGAETQRLWDAVCEDARARVTVEAERDLVCLME